MSLKTRIQKLEHAAGRRRVVPVAYESEEAARAAGAMGGWLCIGPIMTPQAWESAARVQQRDLLGRCAAAT